MAATLTDYNTAISGSIAAYQQATIDDTNLLKSIRVSMNYKLTTYDERIIGLFHRITQDTSMTVLDISTNYGSTIGNYVYQYQKLATETQIQYINRLNNDLTLSKIKYCEIMEDQNSIANETTTNNKSRNDNSTYLNALYYKG